MLTSCGNDWRVLPRLLSPRRRCIILWISSLASILRKEGQCALPVMPALDTDLNMDSGIRFSVKKGSLLE